MKCLSHEVDAQFCGVLGSEDSNPYLDFLEGFENGRIIVSAKKWRAGFRSQPGVQSFIRKKGGRSIITNVSSLPKFAASTCNENPISGSPWSWCNQPFLFEPYPCFGNYLCDLIVFVSTVFLKIALKGKGVAVQHSCGPGFLEHTKAFEERDG